MKKHLLDFKNLTAYTLTNENGQIGALVVFIDFQVTISHNTLNSKFILFLSASANNEIKGFPRPIIFKIDDILKSAIEKKTLVYCYVESGNRNSVILVKKKGFVKAATVKTIGISRFFLKRPIKEEKIIEKIAKNELLDLLTIKYHDHNLLHFDSLFSGDGYYVYRENGEIIAGVQVKKASWVIEKLSGTMGFVIKRFLPYMPIANRIFNPKCFDFLIFDFIYYKPGHVSDFLKLLESMLFLFKTHSGMLWCDKKTSIYKELSVNKSLGVLNSFVNSYETHLYILKDTLPAIDLEYLQSTPVMINPSEFI